MKTNKLYLIYSYKYIKKFKIDNGGKSKNKGPSIFGSNIEKIKK